MASNEQIDKTSYYKLPCGLYLEDFIEHEHLDFKWGCAVKYKYRAGKKDGETEEKDLNKCYHYVNEIAAREAMEHELVYQTVCAYVDEALNWDPPQYVKDAYSEYNTEWRPSK
jgi:hypothetical protein